MDPKKLESAGMFFLICAVIVAAVVLLTCCADPGQPGCPAVRVMNDGTCCPEATVVVWVQDQPNMELYQVCQPFACTPTNRDEWMAPGVCCQEGSLVDCWPGASCDPTDGAGWAEAGYCCRDGIVTICEETIDETADGPRLATQAS